MLEEEALNHLINLLRHSTEVEFHIPNTFLSENVNVSGGITESRKEVKEAIEYFNQSLDHQVSKHNMVESYGISKALGLPIEEETIVKIKVR